MGLTSPSVNDNHTQENFSTAYSFDRSNSCLSLESFFSSSTFTASDLPGPGRLLGKHVYSRGGRALEASLSRLAHQAGLGPVAAAQRVGANLQGFSEDTNVSIEAISANGKEELRLDLGILKNPEGLRKDCKKLFKYTQSRTLTTRIQAYRMLIMLYVRFPYLNAYFDVVDEDLSIYENPDNSNSLERELRCMAYGCVAPNESVVSVSRLVDHLGETTKLGRIHQRESDTGPLSILPDGELIMRYCTNLKTQFASLRFTALIFRHAFLSREREYYLKFNRPTNDFWNHMRDIMKFHLSSLLDEPSFCASCGPVNDFDTRGVDLFGETIFEMLFRAISWHSSFRLTNERRFLLQEITTPFESCRVRILLKNASFVVVSKIRPFLESHHSNSYEDTDLNSIL